MKSALHALGWAVLASAGACAVVCAPIACTHAIDLGSLAVEDDAGGVTDSGTIHDAYRDYGLVPDTGNGNPATGLDADYGCVIVEAGSGPVPTPDAGAPDAAQCTPAVDPVVCGPGASWQVPAPYTVLDSRQTTTATSNFASGSLVVDETGVVVATKPGAVLAALPCAQPSAIYTGPAGWEASQLAADPAAVYVAGSVPLPGLLPPLLRVPRGGGAPTTLWSKPTGISGPLAQDATHLYFGAPQLTVYASSLVRMDKGTGLWDTLYVPTDPLTDVQRVMIDGSTLFWLGGIPSTVGWEVVQSMPLNGTTPSIVARFTYDPGLGAIGAFGVSGGVAVYAGVDPLDHGVLRVPFCDLQMGGDGLGTPPMAVGGGYAYYASPDGLKRMTLASGTTTVLVPAPLPDGNLTNITVGPDGLYYATAHCIYRTSL